MTQTDDALKPCPFCGGRGHIAKDPDLNHGDFYFVKCAKCRAKSTEFHANETCPIFYAQVRDAWNTRADLAPTPQDARVAALVEALRDIADGMGEMTHREIGRYAPAVARAALAAFDKGGKDE